MGSTKEQRDNRRHLWYGAPDCPVYTGQCLVHQRTPTQTRHLREFLEVLRYNSPDCPVYTGLSGVHRTVFGAPRGRGSGTWQPREFTTAAPL
jgi:hypothetical protein